MTIDNLPVDYVETIVEIKEIIKRAQIKALKNVNKELILLYWEIGRIIVEKQESDNTWGKSVVKKIAKDLQQEFQGTRGFSSQNLWNMRNYYLAYRGNKKLQTLSREISWSHNLGILNKCQNGLRREFYIRMSICQEWSCRELKRMITENTYEKIILNQNNFQSNLPEPISSKAAVLLKDEYALNFLKEETAANERDLEEGILGNITSFLKEMGGNMAFIENQFKIVVDGHEFFIDLLLAHRKLNCLVAIELKNGEFRPEYIGKMQFYLEA